MGDSNNGWVDGWRVLYEWKMRREIKQRHLYQSIELIKLYPSAYRMRIVHRHTYMQQWMDAIGWNGVTVWIKTWRRGIGWRHLYQSIELIKLYPSTYRLMLEHIYFFFPPLPPLVLQPFFFMCCDWEIKDFFNGANNAKTHKYIYDGR